MKKKRFLQKKSKIKSKKAEFTYLKEKCLNFWSYSLMW